MDSSGHPASGAGRARDGFLRSYGRPAQYVGRAPGRVNLIGEHTDYNGGLCLPIAIGQSTWAAVAAREDGALRFSSGAGSPWHGAAADLRPGATPGWAAYPAGVLWALRAAGWPIGGLDLHIESDVPLGAGLSSSAALTVAVAMALAGLTGTDDEPDLRETVRRATISAETEYVGAPTGGLDQTAVLYAEPDAAVLIDFAGGPHRLVPWRPHDAGLHLLVIDTRVGHAHRDGGYSRRRAECEQAARMLGVTALAQTDADLRGLPAVLRRRVQHVRSETQRVSETIAATADADWQRVGRLWQESHRSLREDFEVSCPELDLAVAVAVEHGALGARMTGGGFGGSVIALVPESELPQVCRSLTAAFAAGGLSAPTLWTVRAAAGAGLD